MNCHHLPDTKGLSLALPTWAWVALVVVLTNVFVVGRVSFWHWNIEAGIYFACLWLAPRRAWWWMALGYALSNEAFTLWANWHSPEGVDISVGEVGFSAQALTAHILALWADPFLCLLPAALLRRMVRRTVDIATSTGAVWLHITALLAALLQTGTDIFYVANSGWVADVRDYAVVDPVRITRDNIFPLLSAFGLKNLLGYFLGTMLAVPTVTWMVAPRLRHGSAQVLKQAAIWVAPVALGFVLIADDVHSANLIEFLRLLLLVAVVVFAARHGWRGAVISILAVSLVLAAEDHMAQATSQSIIWMQLFVAIAGAMALMFGSSLDHLRMALDELHRTHAREQAMARELADAVGRNVRATEVERGRVAMELHDSVGQSITALQTQLKLMELDAPTQDLPWLGSLRGLVMDMRRAVSESIEALRPSALNELGLLKAIDRGSIRRHAESAGLAFSLQTRSADGLTALDDAASVAAYRIVQEAVNNVVRHARATQVHVRLNLYWRRDKPWLVLAVEDDGVGVSLNARSGNGLRNMRDRALMLGGEVRIGASHPAGTRVRAWLQAQ